MHAKLALVFGAGFLVAVVVGLGPGRSAVDCETGDLTRGAVPTSTTIEALFGDWIHQVRACHVGEYLVVVPTRAGVPDVLLSRNGKPFLLASRTVTMVMDEDRVLYDRERGRKIAVAAYNPAQRAWIEQVDVNADGTIDWRTTERADAPTRHEVRVGDRWLEVVKRRGPTGSLVTGTIVNGRFMSIDEARAASGVNEAAMGFARLPE